VLNRNVTPKRSQSLIAGLAAERIAEGLLLCGESRSLIEASMVTVGTPAITGCSAAKAAASLKP